VYERVQTVVRARNPAHITEAAEIGTEEESSLFFAKEEMHAYPSTMTQVKMSVAAIADISVIRESHCILASKTKAENVKTPAWKVCNFCKILGHFAYACWKRKKRHGNFSGNENSIPRERRMGKLP
jgi:hypothetical protein